MKGEIVEFAIYDAGAEFALERIERIAGLSVRKAPLVSRSPIPPYAAFPAPQTVRLEGEHLGQTPPGLRVDVRIHRIGGVALRVRYPFDVDDILDIPTLLADLRIEGRTLPEATDHLARQVLAETHHALVERYDVTVEPERYTAVVLTDTPGGPDKALKKHRRELAALVQGERDPEVLADETVESVFDRVLRYSRQDAVAAGWDNAVVLSPEGTYEDVLDVIELANLELLELRTYDAWLDRKLDDAFEALQRLWSRGGLLRSARHALADISDLRVDFAQLTDALNDTGKLFGDWYLAKLHRRLADRFHLEDWEKAIEKKMGTLEDMFQLAEEETNQRRGLLLEILVVVLVILDLLLVLLLARG